MTRYRYVLGCMAASLGIIAVNSTGIVNTPLERAAMVVVAVVVLLATITFAAWAAKETR